MNGIRSAPPAACGSPRRPVRHQFLRADKRCIRLPYPYLMVPYYSFLFHWSPEGLKFAADKSPPADAAYLWSPETVGFLRLEISGIHFPTHQQKRSVASPSPFLLLCHIHQRRNIHAETRIASSVRRRLPLRADRPVVVGVNFASRRLSAVRISLDHDRRYGRQ